MHSKNENQTPVTAVMFAAGAHCAMSQRRKYTGEPYIVHPFEVMVLVGKTPGATEEMMMAAALHDTVEDTGVTLADIALNFGAVIAKLVEECTDIARPEDGCRAVRVAINRAHAAKASPEAQTIKLADIISNCQNIAQSDPDFAATYLDEKRLALDVLTQGDKVLHRHAHILVHSSLDQLKAVQ